MMTPTESADSQPSEDQDASRKRSRNLLTETCQRKAKRPCTREETNDADETSQPRQQTEKTNGSTEKEQGPRRRNIAWEDIGLRGYNPQPTKWECRFGHIQQEMDTERLTPYHRNKLHPEHSLGKKARNNMPILQQDL